LADARRRKENDGVQTTPAVERALEIDRQRRLKKKENKTG